MDTLPEELLALICAYCDHASNKNLRLVARRLEAASTPAVFEHFYMGLFEYGLDKLTTLTKSSISKHVKQFTIFADIMPAWQKGAFLRAIDLRPEFSEWCRIRQGHDARASYDELPRHDLNENELTAAWTAYQAIHKQQRKWRHDQHAMRMKELISSLINLTEVHVKVTTPFSSHANYWPVWKGLRERTKVGPDDWRYLTDHFDVDYSAMCGHAAIAIIEAVGYRSTFFGIKPITKLEVHSSHLGSYNDLFDHQSRPLMSAFMLGLPRPGTSHTASSTSYGSKLLHNMRVDGFRHLTSLRLHVPHATFSTRLYGENLRLETIQFLRAARQLSHLDLRYTDDELSPDMDEELPQLETLFDSDVTLWPYLKCLCLATNLNASILLKFLQNHADTLERLELRDMCIKNVRQAIEQIPLVLHLHSVHLECLWDWDESPEGKFLCVLSRGTEWDDPYEQNVKAYLLRRIQELPKLAWDGGHGSDIMSIGSGEAELSDEDGQDTDDG